MKNIILTTLLATGLFCTAQDYHTPASSPRQTVIQEFSYSDVTVDYSRPSMKGREIFGELVPLDKLWRLGANEATTIAFKQDVLFGEKMVKKGKYSMFAIPSKEKWTIILNKNADQWGAYNYDEKEDALRIEVPTIKMSYDVETLLISLNEFKDDSLNLSIVWDNTGVSVPIQVADTVKADKVVEHLKAIAEIEKD